MSETIFFVQRSVPLPFDPDITHAYFLYQNSTGDEYFLSGGPSFSAPFFGPIKAFSGPLIEGSYEDPNEYPQLSKVSLLSGENLLPAWIDLASLAATIDALDIPYLPGTMNSNSVAAALLDRLEMQWPQTGFSAPGAGNDLSHILTNPDILTPPWLDPEFVDNLNTPYNRKKFLEQAEKELEALDEHLCFAKDTQISLPDGTSRAIQDIHPGDYVLAFDPLLGGEGELVPKRVVRTFEGITKEWLTLSNNLIVTPGHHFLTSRGVFSSIDRIIRDGKPIVLANGQLATLAGQRIVYSEETRGSFEEMQEEQFFSSAGLALSPSIEIGWKTYNFEVEGFHTYVAGGVRVHNASLSVGTLATELQDADPAERLAIAIYNADSENPYDELKDYRYSQDKAVFNAGTTSEIYSQQEKHWRTDLLQQMHLADGTHMWVVQYRDQNGRIVTKDADTGVRIDPSLLPPDQGQPMATLEAPKQGDSPDGGKSVYLATGTLAEVGKTYESGGYTYVVNPDGTTTNTQTGHTYGGDDDVRPGEFNHDTGTFEPTSGGPRSLVGPVVLDLTGDGVDVDPLSSSNFFFDMAGDGKQHRTAWAGAGDGVLVRDDGNDGVINQHKEIDFTEWDPTAESDLQALLNVFDTDHDGKLDAGDADWSLFKVLVTNADGTTTLKTLAQLGITSIDLITNNQEIVLADGSRIIGTSSFTRSDGSTGRAGDVELVYETEGYVVTRTVTPNPDGSTTIENVAARTDGSIASTTTATISADGNARTAQFDDDGDGVTDRVQTETKVTNGDGSITETLSDYDGSGTILARQQVTATSADGDTVTVSLDADGSGVFDRIETRVTAANGDLAVTVRNVNADGSTRNETTTTTSADGLGKTTQVELTGSGAVNASRAEATAVDGSGTRTETVTDYAGSGMTAAHRIASTVTTTAADGSSKTIVSDLDGDADTDLTTSSTIVRNGDGSTTTTQNVSNGDTSLRAKVVTDLSADGHSETTQSDLDGDSDYDLVSTDITTFDPSDTTTQTVTNKAGNSDVLSKTVSSWSADGKTRSTNVDSDGDGNYDRIQSVAEVSGSSVDTASIYSADGSTLISRSVTTTSADGLTRTTQIDVDGDATYDAVQSQTTVINGDGSSSVTAVTRNGAGTIEVAKTVSTTSADGLSTTLESFRNGETDPYKSVSSVKVLNIDDSVTQTVTTFSGANDVQTARAVTTISADRLTMTTNTYVGTNTAPETVTTTVTAIDGSKTQTVWGYSTDGSVLLGKSVTTTSADGLTTTVTSDGDGDGDTDGTQQSVTTLNADGTTMVTSNSYAGAGTAAGNRQQTSIVTSSGNGLEITTQRDADADGTYDAKTIDETVLNSDGSKTRTITSSNGDGTVQTGKTVSTVSDDGLTRSVETYLGDSTTPDLEQTEATVLNADGSTVTTASTYSGNGSLVSQAIITRSGDGLSTTSQTDLDGNGVDDVVTAVTTNADGSVTTVTSTYSEIGTLDSRSTRTVSGDGLSMTIATDLDGDGVTDETITDVVVLNADGSKTRTVSTLDAAGALTDKTVTATSADGLAITTVWEGLGAGTTRTRTETTLVNADGSTTRTVSNLNPDGSLHDKTITTLSADGTTVRTTDDIDGDGIVDETRVETHLTNGDVLRSNMDGTVQSASGREYGAGQGKYITASGDGLSTTIHYDDDGNGLAERQTTDVTVLNADGTRVQTITTSDLSGGDPNAADPVYTQTKIDQSVITTSADGRTVTTQYDLTGSGTLGSSREIETVFNADGSSSETTSYRDGITLTSQFVVTRSGDDLTQTTQWDTDGSGTPDEVATRVITRNADGSQTVTVTNTTFGGALLSKEATTTSADGRTVVVEEDPHGSGTYTRTETTETITLADGGTIVTVTNAESGALLDRNVTQTSANGRLVTLTRDADGDGVTDQVKEMIKHVDGSTTIDLRDFAADGSLTGRTLTSKTADGRQMTSQQDVDGDGVFDRQTVHTWHDFADGSTQETIEIYKISERASDGTVTSISPVLQQKATITVSADGRTETSSVDIDVDGTADEVTTAASRIDGSMVINVTANALARAVVPLAGEIRWVSAIVAGATAAAATEVSVSADQRIKTVKADYDGNATFEHEEVWTTRIDGAQTALITDKDASGVVVASGVITVSSDGLITTLDRDNDNDGIVDYREQVVARVDGSAVKTAYERNAQGEFEVVWVTTSHSNGQSLTIIGTAGDDTLLGGQWNDILVGNGGNDTLDGGAGADRLEGGAGDDILIVDNGGDVVVEQAGQGTDLVRASATYTLSANVENLTLIGSGAINGTGNAEANVITGNDAANTLFGKAGNDTLTGGLGDDTLAGGAGADTLDGGDGEDTATYETAAGNIYLDLRYGAQTFAGDAEGDTFQGIETIRGTSYDDEIQVVADDATVYGGSGDDYLATWGLSGKIYGEAGSDVLWGDVGSDILVGGAGADELHGDDGFDIASYETSTTGVFIDTRNFSLSTGDAAGDYYDCIEAIRGSAYDDEFIANLDYGVLYGGAGNDVLSLLGLGGDIHGDDGNDSLTAGSGDNTLAGGAGDDILIGGADCDALDGGEGFDIASYETATSGIYLHTGYMASNSGDAYGDSFSSIEGIKGTSHDDEIISVHAGKVWGGAGEDTITFANIAGWVDGGADYDRLHGGGAADTLLGGTGADDLYGHGGDDVIEGGAGNEWLVGGSGNDTFVFRFGDGWDDIDDFEVHGGTTSGDVIEFHDMNITFAELMASASEWNGTTYIDLDNGHGFTLFGISVSQLTADDFRFQ